MHTLRYLFASARQHLARRAALRGFQRERARLERDVLRDTVVADPCERSAKLAQLFCDQQDRFARLVDACARRAQ